MLTDERIIPALVAKVTEQTPKPKKGSTVELPLSITETAVFQAACHADGRSADDVLATASAEAGVTIKLLYSE